MLTAQQENERTLAAFLGLSEEEAVTKLCCKVFINASPLARALAKDIGDLLDRTLQVVSGDQEPDVEITIGATPATTAQLQIWASVTSDGMTLGVAPENGTPVFTEIPGLTRRVAACYAAGFVLNQVLGGERLEGIPSPFCLDFTALGLDPLLLNKPIRLDNAVLVGAGGVANGFLWGLQELTVSGELIIVDPKNVGGGNLNRCLFFGSADLGHPKAECLKTNAGFRDLKLGAHVGEFRDLLAKMGRVATAISTVDSRRVRRSIQSGLPLNVLDASTTDISEVVIHSHSQPTKNACLACIYAHIPDENQREQDVANGLGVTVEDVQRDFIDAAVAEKIVQAHPDLQKNELIGLSLFSLFKARCAEGLLKSSGGKQVLAPFAFISNLAGVLLALELALFENGERAQGDSVYMTLDPWRPPHARARRQRPRNPDCKFCGQSSTQEAYRAVWPEIFGCT